MEEELQDKPFEIPELHQVVSLIRRRRWHFLLPLFAGWLLVWGISWFLPSVYRSGTLILVEQPAVPEKLVASNIDNDIQRQLDSISQQILSRTRLVQIIDHLNLYANERKHRSPDDLVEEMRKDIEIELSRGDDRKLSAFNIYYSSRDPKMAQLATSELASLFISENLEQRQERSENTTRFLEDQLDQARQKLAEQEARVREFKDKHIGELPSQTQSNLQILGGLQAQLQAQEDSLNRARQQNTYFESLLGQYRSLERGTKPGEGGPVGLAAIDKELDRLRAQLADLSSRYTDKHPDVRKTREQIANTERMRERVIADMNNAGSNAAAEGSSATSTPKSAPVLELESQLKANRTEIANRQAEIRNSQNKIGEYQGRLNRAPVMEQQFTDITRDYEQSKANYDSLLAKKNQSAMATDLEKTQQGEHFRMLDPPNLPVKPDKPNRLKLCALGLVVGLILGGVTAAGSEIIGGKVHTEREIKKIVPFEIFAEIPTLQTAAEQTAERRSALLAGATGAVILFCILAGSAITYLRG
jgi:polysaccharide chain length determinant protein (PEP-CTERM system associated)